MVNNFIQAMKKVKSGLSPQAQAQGYPQAPVTPGPVTPAPKKKKPNLALMLGGLANKKAQAGA